MEQHDTTNLLKECDSGTKMAVSAIDEVLEYVKDGQLRLLLEKSRGHHKKLGDEIHTLLLARKSEEKDPPLAAKGMSWMKTNLKMTLDERDSTIADLITDGCAMGIKSLHRYLNQYTKADPIACDICRRLAAIEEELWRDLRAFL